MQVWWQGPEFLQEDEAKWPQRRIKAVSSDVERKKNVKFQGTTLLGVVESDDVPVYTASCLTRAAIEPEVL